MKVIGIIVLFLSALCVHEACAQEKVVRIEGDYVAEYSFSNDVSDGNAKETGKVIYYLYPKKDGKHKVEYDKYIAGMTCNINNPTEQVESLGVGILSQLWPVPGTIDSDTTTVTRDILPLLSGDDKKLMKFIGMGMDVQKWEIDDAYLPSGALETMTQYVTFTGNGVNFRRVFGAVPTKCSTKVCVTLCSTTALSPEEAKAARKAERALYAKK